MTTTMTQSWNQFLADRFTDFDEIRDVANYGCIAGVNGFIYSTELNQVFDRFENEIIDLCEQLEVPISDLVEDETCWTIQEVKEKSVWIAVEYYCASKALEGEYNQL